MAKQYLVTIDSSNKAECYAIEAVLAQLRVAHEKKSLERGVCVYRIFLEELSKLPNTCGIPYIPLDGRGYSLHPDNENAWKEL